MLKLLKKEDFLKISAKLEEERAEHMSQDKIQGKLMKKLSRMEKTIRLDQEELGKALRRH